jgi:hypothetical protein
LGQNVPKKVILWFSSWPTSLALSRLRQYCVFKKRLNIFGIVEIQNVDDIGLSLMVKPLLGLSTVQ